MWIGYPLADYLKKPPTITIPAAYQQSTPRPAVVNPPPTLLYPRAYNRVKNYLKDMLRTQLTRHETHPDDRMHPIFTELSAVRIVEDLRHQLEAYWHNEWPFDTPVKDGDPLTWWRNLSDHPHGRVLSVSYYYF